MEGQTIQRAGSACLIFDISEFQHVSKLPEGVQSRWKAFSRVKLHGDRAQRLRTATHRIYSSIEVRNEAGMAPCAGVRVGFVPDMTGHQQGCIISYLARAPSIQLRSSDQKLSQNSL